MAGRVMLLGGISKYFLKSRGRDKIVQKMTKDGLVDENLRTGEQKSATAEEKPEKEDSAEETAEKETDEPPVEE